METIRRRPGRPRKLSCTLKRKPFKKPMKRLSQLNVPRRYELSEVSELQKEVENLLKNRFENDVEFQYKGKETLDELISIIFTFPSPEDSAFQGIFEYLQQTGVEIVNSPTAADHRKEILYTQLKHELQEAGVLFSTEQNSNKIESTQELLSLLQDDSENDNLTNLNNIDSDRITTDKEEEVTDNNTKESINREVRIETPLETESEEIKVPLDSKENTEEMVTPIDRVEHAMEDSNLSDEVEFITEVLKPVVSEVIDIAEEELNPGFEDIPVRCSPPPFGVIGDFDLGQLFDLVDARVDLTDSVQLHNYLLQSSRPSNPILDQSSDVESFYSAKTNLSEAEDANSDENLRLEYNCKNLSVKIKKLPCIYLKPEVPQEPEQVPTTTPTTSSPKIKSSEEVKKICIKRSTRSNSTAKLVQPKDKEARADTVEDYIVLPPFPVKSSAKKCLSKNAPVEEMKMIMLTTPPDLDKLSALMKETLNYRRGFLKKKTWSVKKGFDEFPAFKIFQIMKEEFSLINGPIQLTDRMEFLEMKLNDTLKNASRRTRKRPGQIRHLIWQNAINLAKNYQIHQKQKVLGMLCLSFYLAESAAATKLFHIGTEILNRVTTPTLLISSESSIFEVDEEMWVYADGIKCLRVPNFYEGVLTVYAMHYVFDVQYDSDLQELFLYFDKIALI